ncbi:hypothetical protein PG993_007104 [Apiospora rasikravindrae]|uniref:Uncharacterized protein n=1 Tax=Apiospora rasikravindrae TaxID=990691 RepID=A0ABR1SWL2_9PEZI
MALLTEAIDGGELQQQQQQQQQKKQQQQELPQMLRDFLQYHHQGLGQRQASGGVRQRVGSGVGRGEGSGAEAAA